MTTKELLEKWQEIANKNKMDKGFDKMKNDLERIESPIFIPMDVVIEKHLGANLTPEQKEYFKDKVLTSMHISDFDGITTEITDSKATVTVNYTNL